MKKLLLLCFLIAPAHAMDPANATPSTAPNRLNSWRLFGFGMASHQLLVVHAMRDSGAELNPEDTPAQNRLDAFIARTDGLVVIQGPQRWLHMRDSDQEDSDLSCNECCVWCIEPQPEGCFRLLTDYFRSGN